MKTLVVFLANIVFFFAGCAANRSQTMNTQSDEVAIISRYVSARKGWSPNQYRIEVAERGRVVTMYMVVYLEDEKKAIPGGGESFEVVYDRVRKRVVRELGLQ